MSLRLATWLLLAVVWTAGCDRAGQSAKSKVEPAKVAHHVEEQSLNTITLTEHAAQRLAIALADVRTQSVQQRRIVGGEVVIPPGQTIAISAPLAGMITLPDGATAATVGSKVAAAQPIFALQPLLTPERDVLTPADRVKVAQSKTDIATAQLVAQREVEAAALRVDAAQIAYDRAKKLFDTKAGSKRSVDETSANLQLAQQAELTAKERHQFMAAINLDEAAGDLSPRTISAPVAGVLQSVEVAAGETVVSGEPLFHIVQMDEVWIRVPVYVGHWRNIDTAAGASIAEYGQSDVVNSRHADYVAAPPSANALATTVDLFYKIDNADGRLYPGQKVQVTLPQGEREECLVVPFAAVVYDVHGGAWVYEEVKPLTYARRRVAVRYVDGDDAILAAGPPSGTIVVTDGAVELFGTEFGVGH